MATYSAQGTVNYGTVEEQLARKKQQQQQAPYEASAPSAQAAGTVAQSNTGSPLDFAVSPTGAISYNNQSEQDRRLMQFKAGLDADAEAKRLANMRDDRTYLLSKMSGTATTPRVGGSNIAADENAARSAAFARAKDQAGQIARASLSAISENMANRGITGSGIEALRSAGAITGADAPLQELTRDQLMLDLNRAADISDTTYQGEITQRGQDLAAKQSYLNLLRSLY